MTTWRALILVIVAAPAAAQPPDANYDEAKVPAYTLPDPLRFEDGRQVTSPDGWQSRRSEILRLFEEHVYGRSPGAPKAIRFAVVETASKALGGLATRRQVRVLLDGTESGPAFELLVYVPNAAPRPGFAALKALPAAAAGTGAKLPLLLRSSRSGCRYLRLGAVCSIVSRTCPCATKMSFQPSLS